MLVTDTPTVEGRKIVKYCGIVTGEAILGANVFKDLFAGIRDIVGGRSATYERELQRAWRAGRAGRPHGRECRRRGRPRLRGSRKGK